MANSDLSPRNTNFDDEEVTYVITRTGRKEPLNTDQITKRLRTLINKAPKIPHVNPYDLMLDVCKGLKSGISTYEIDEYAANASASLSISNPHYLSIAARIAIDNHQKNTMRSFVDKMRKAYLNVDDECKVSPLINEEFFKYVEEHQDFIESVIDYSRDFLFDFFGFRTFQKSYSTKVNDVPIERPQDMYMRTAIALNMNTETDIKEEYQHIKETYDLLSTKCYTHASPTYYNAGGVYPQYASCFLLGTGDSLEEIEKTGTDMSRISKRAGGIGVHVNSWRSTGSRIRGTNGKSSGIVPFLRSYGMRMRAFNQGGRRPGSAAIYLMPHHPDLLRFLALRRNDGIEEERARDLFYALWIPDIFMERIESNGIWSFFDPDHCGDLSNLYGAAYRARYLELESQKKYKGQMPAREIWQIIKDVEQDTGMPYICFADTVNAANMQSHLGTIKSSNLCVSGDTLVLTDQGYKPIKELSETNPPTHHVWNGTKFSLATFAKTGVDKKLLKVTFSDGVELKCTPEHRFALSSGVKRTSELVPGDRLRQCSFPTIGGNAEIQAIQTMFYCNGFYTSKQGLSSVSRDKSKLMDIKLVSNTLGLNPVITQTSDNVYSLTYNYADCLKMRDLGIKDAEYVLSSNILFDHNKDVTVSSITPLDILENTYCFNEPSSHTGIFNGVLAMNCSEIALYSDTKEYAVCVLASVSLASMVVDAYSSEELSLPEDQRRLLNHAFPVNPMFDFRKLLDVVKVVVRNLNHVVDKTYHPVVETKRSNERHRPLGIGVQGLADAYAKMRFPFDSPDAKKLNKEIFEAIYFAALTASSVLSRKKYTALKEKCKLEGSVTVPTYKPDDYETYMTTYTNPADIPKKICAFPSLEWNGGSPIAKGTFHWELYGLKPDQLSGMFDWESLRQHILTFGVCNSHLVALMPTASTSQLLGNNECFEPYTSNVYKRDTSAGEFIVINKYLINDLYSAGLWTKNLKDYLIASEGSIQNIDGVPEFLKELYKTAWEIDPSVLVQQAIDRQPNVDQMMSLNLYIRDFSLTKWNKLMFQAWKGKLKTGKYYAHTESAVMPVKFTIDPSKEKEMAELLAKKTTRTDFMNPLHEVCDVCSA